MPQAPQQVARVDEMVRKNMKAVADRVTTIVNDANAEVVFVTGEIRSRADLIAALPERGFACR